MKQIFSFILGALLMVAIGAFAQSSGIQVFKPATPKQVMVRSHIGFPDKVSRQIQENLVNGWILKSFTSLDGAVIVVYEKY